MATKTKKAAVNPEDDLLPRVNKSLNPLMLWIALPLLLAAAAPLPKPVVAQVHVIASVEIVAGEEVRARRPEDALVERARRLVLRDARAARFRRHLPQHT